MSSEGIAEVMKNHSSEVDMLLRELHSVWTPEKDAQLTAYANLLYSKTGESSTSLPVKMLTIPSDPQALQAFPQLQYVEERLLRARFGMLKLFNHKLSKVLSLIDLSNLAEPSSLGHKLIGIKHKLFLDTKMDFWNTIISKTMSYACNNLKLNRRQATEQPDKERIPLFVQAFDQLCDLNEKSYRSSDKPFEVSFSGEGGTDGGGLFRDAMDSFSEEIHSKHFPMLVPCANGVNNVGFNRDKFIPNPSYNSPRELAMFHFLGKLLGTHLRLKSTFPLKFPPAVWKLLVNIYTQHYLIFLRWERHWITTIWRAWIRYAAKV